MPKWEVVHDLGVVARHPGVPLAVYLQKARRAAAPLLRGHDPKPFIREKISAGLILVRTPRQTAAAGGASEYQAVMVQGRLTYAYSEFVHGRYDKNRLDSVRQLVAQMTIRERQAIASLNFEQIWELAWPRQHRRQFSWKPGSTTFARLKILRWGWGEADPASDPLYIRRRAAFSEAWLGTKEAGETLRTLLYETKGIGQGRWEYPKGKRQSRAESDLSCALREFHEETRIPLKNIRVVPDFARIEMYIHMDVLYVNTFYLAVLVHAIPDPASEISLANVDQVSEVSDVKWMGLNAMRLVKGAVGRDLAVLARAAFGHVKKSLGRATA